jgi:hypothetical protein
MMDNSGMSSTIQASAEFYRDIRLDVALADSDELSDIEFIVDDAGATGPVAADSGVTPENAAWAGHLLVVEAAGDRVGRKRPAANSEKMRWTISPSSGGDPAAAALFARERPAMPASRTARMT